MAKKKSTTKKLLITAGVIIAVLVIGVFLAKSMGWIGGEGSGKSVQTAEAKYKTITQQVSASGKIQPESEVIIRSDVSGEIINLNVKEGDYVRKGDLLLRIRPDTYQARIDEQNAALLTQKAREEEARSNMLEAKTSYERQKKLHDKDLTSESQYSQAKTNYETKKSAYQAAKYQVKSVQAQLQQAKEELEKTIIRAPRDGTVSTLAVEEGESVLGNVRTAGTEIMHIAGMNHMEVQVDVNENDIVNVAVGDTVNIQADSYPERTFNGVVTEIANSAQVSGAGTTEQVTNYEVKIRITTPHNLDMTGAHMKKEQAKEITSEGSSPDFKPGMSATVDIQTKTVPRAIAIPIQAVTVRNFAGESASTDSTQADSAAADSTDGQIIPKEDLRKVVFVVREGKAHRQQVKTGISDNTHIRVLSGVKTGDEVVIGSYRTLSKQLTDGDAVNVNNDQFKSYTANN